MCPPDGAQYPCLMILLLARDESELADCMARQAYGAREWSMEYGVRSDGKKMWTMERVFDADDARGG